MRAALCLLLCLVASSLQRSTPSDRHYVAAVLEYSQHSTTQDNLAEYVQFIQQAAQQNADIVVFPEMTLTRSDVVPIPIHGLLHEFPTPALHPTLYHEVLVQLSRAAREHAIYVVVNVQEEMDCSSTPQPLGEVCPTSEVYRFNTNVVFDRSGSVIDRYRKINLFGEASRTPALDDQLGIFTTDFGVTFGHFICFDLMFQVPAIQVVQKYNITDVVFTTMWFSEMPFLTAVEIQEAYAFANNVNMLASGASRVAVGSAGSGIYSGRAGALVSTMPGVDTRKLLVSRVPKVPGEVQGMEYPGHLPNDPKVMDSLWLKRDQSLPAHVSRVIPETEEPQTFVLRDGSVTCRFYIQLRDLHVAGEQGHYRYRAFVQDGINTYAHRDIGVSACAVFACLDHQPASCAVRSLNTTSKYEFTNLQIVQTSHKPKLNETLECNDSIYYPVTLKSEKYPINAENIIMRFKPPIIPKHADEKKYIDMQRTLLKLVKPEKDILTFGIWGRIFDRDVNRRDEMDEETKKRFEEFEESLA